MVAYIDAIVLNSSGLKIFPHFHRCKMILYIVTISRRQVCIQFFFNPLLWICSKKQCPTFEETANCFSSWWLWCRYCFVWLWSSYLLCSALFRQHFIHVQYGSALDFLISSNLFCSPKQQQPTQYVALSCISLRTTTNI